MTGCISKRKSMISYLTHFKTCQLMLTVMTISYLLVAMLSSFTLTSNNNAAFAVTSQKQQGDSPDINAQHLFNTGTIVLPNSVKNLIITIPDEAHHAPNAEPLKRYINQTFLPQNAVINPGTTVVWFSSDAGHDHVINVNDQNNATIFKSGTFTFNTATKPIKFNNTRTYAYSDPVNALSKEAGVNGFKMTGTVRVANPSSSALSATNPTNSNKIDTVGVEMVPAKTVDQYISEFKNHGFGIDSMQKFKALRNNSQEMLLVWTSYGADLSKVLSGLKQITSTTSI